MLKIVNRNPAEAEAAARKALQKNLLNGKLSHLQKLHTKIFYEVKVGITELVPSFRFLDIAFEPRFNFEGTYDIIIGIYLKIRTNITGKFNRCEIGYGYVAPILYSDDFPFGLAETISFGEIYFFNGKYTDSLCLNFETLRGLVIGLMQDKHYLDNFLKIDLQNKIIFYEIPNMFEMDDLFALLEIGRMDFDDMFDIQMGLIIEGYKDKKNNVESSIVSEYIFRRLYDIYIKLAAKIEF